MVTAAGTPYRRWAAIAPGATEAMNACWPGVSGTAVAGAADWLRPYGAAAGAAGPGAGEAAGAGLDGAAGRPGMVAPADAA
jgi:hypothetical protein